jgi:hypothetical protein
MRITAPVLIAALAFASCSDQMPPQPQQLTTDTLVIDPAGNYVTSDYTLRNEGYDWVSVAVTQRNDTTVGISVRSRADKKKPTCTFDVLATRMNDSTFSALAEGKNILFVFNDTSLSIAAQQPEDEGILSYFCSGGGSLASTYRKIDGPLDEQQIDPSVFNKTLVLQNIGFEIITTGIGSMQQLTVQPFGLKTDNQKVSMEIDGSVTGAEIEDLNRDGFPEVVIYVTSAGSGSYGNVIGFSVNNGKSMSRIAFPSIADDPKASKGYMGHDEFALVETDLVRRFRVFKEGDSNSKPTGNYRQLHYKLVNGEASRIFVLDRTVEIPAN